jgi:hypothetical protein
MKNIQNMVLFSIILTTVCGATGVVAMEKNQKKQQLLLKKIDLKIQRIRKHGETLSVGLQPIQVKKINKLERQQQRIQSNVDAKNIRLFNACKVNVIPVKLETHKTQSKKNKKYQVGKKIFQASPERNKMIFYRLLHQAKDQLHDHNKVADLRYEKKSSWKMKDTLKQQHLRLKK